MNGKTDKELLIAKTRDSIQKCDRHILRIEEALVELDSVLPLTIDTYEHFDSSKVRATDQLLFRFSKLQDEIGRSIIKSMCDLLENTRENTSFIDYLNIAEKYEILESAHDWDIIQTIRNSITHDYENDNEYQVQTINDVYNAYKKVRQIFDNIKNKLNQISAQ